MNATKITRSIRQAFTIAVLGTLLGCSEDGADPKPSIGGNNEQATGKGGSMARFAIAGDQLYTVSTTSLKNFSIQDPEHPVLQNDIQLGTGIETIFPYNNNLFIGTQFGMQIYSLANPASPVHVSTFTHITSCDPVVAQGNYAYVTLRASGTGCSRGVNELHVVDISNLNFPRLQNSVSMQEPYGLGVDGNTLFVCDKGLKVFQISNPINPVQTKHFPIQAYDVIPDGGNLMVIGQDGLYQYAYQNGNISLLSKINILHRP